MVNVGSNTNVDIRHGDYIKSERYISVIQVATFFNFALLIAAKKVFVMFFPCSELLDS